MLQEIARTIPNDTWLTAFQGTSSAATAASSDVGVVRAVTPDGRGDRRRPTTTTTTGDDRGRGTGATATTPTTATDRRRRRPRPAGTATFTVVGLDFPSVSAWIQRIGTQIPSFTDLWVPTASRGGADRGRERP